MNEARYVIMRLEDAKLVANKLAEAETQLAPVDPKISEITDRLQAETGADIEEIVQLLRTSSNIYVQKQGRRLRRLLERANHTKPAAVEEPPPEQYVVVTKKSQAHLVATVEEHAKATYDLIAAVVLLLDVSKPVLANKEWWLNEVIPKLDAHPARVLKLRRAVTDLSYLERY